MSVRWKLGIGFSLVVLMLWLTVAVVLWSIHAVNVEIELTANNIIPGAMAMSEMDQAAHEAAYELLNRATRDSVGPGEQSAERLRLALRRLAKAAASHLEHEAHVGDPERREARELLARARTLSVAVEALVDASHGEAMELDGERVHSALDSLVTLLRNHRTTHLQELDVAIGSVGRAHTTVVRTIIPLALLMTFFAAMGAWLTARSLARSLQVLHASELRQKRLSSMLRLMCDNLPAFIWAKDLQNRFQIGRAHV